MEDVSSDTMVDQYGRPLRRLPEVKKRVIWREDSGTWVSPSGKSFPSRLERHLPVPGKANHKKPRMLDDGTIYYGWYPLLATHTGPVLGRLSVLDSTIADTLEAGYCNDKYRTPGFRVSASIASPWARLEDALLAIGAQLLERHPDSALFPKLDFPRWPHEFGYRVFHTTREKAIASGLRAREAFVTLTAVVSFALSLWLGEYESTCFYAAWSQLHSRQDMEVDSTWLSTLQNTYICNFSTNTRAGGGLFALNTKWGPWLHNFVRAGVNIVLLWGKPEDWPLDMEMDYDFMELRRRYYPPPEYIEASKKRCRYLTTQASSSFVLPSHDNEHPSFEPDNFNSVYDNQEPFQVAPVSDPDPATVIEPGSFQKQGETVEEFHARMAVKLEKMKAYESASEKQSREDKERNAANGHRVGDIPVFTWQEHGNFWRRMRVFGQEIETQWKQVGKRQRVYLSALKQWDLCPQLLEFEPGTKVPDTGSYFDKIFAQGDALGPKAPMKPKDFFQPPELIFSQAPPPPVEYRFPTPALVEFFASRFGYRVVAGETWHPDLHLVGTVMKQQDIGKTILHLAHIDIPSLQDIQGLGPEPIDEQHEMSQTIDDLAHVIPPTLNDVKVGLVDLFNICRAAAESKGCGGDYKLLPSTFDFSPLSFRPIVDIDPRRFTLILASTLPAADEEGGVEGETVYILKPPRGSQDPATWCIAMKDPLTVLQVFRSRWMTMFEAARGLLEVNVAFHTVCQRRLEEVRVREHPIIRGLGERKATWTVTADEERLYKDARQVVFESDYGRSCRLAGGIVGRLSYSAVSECCVLDGPVHCDLIVAYDLDDEGTVYCDDQLPPEQEDVVCGSYLVENFEDLSEASKTFKTLSWWPRQSFWVKYGPGLGAWTQQAEAFFNGTTKRYRDRDESKSLALKNNTEWRRDLRKQQQHSILKAARAWAAQFIQDKTSN